MTKEVGKADRLTVLSLPHNIVHIPENYRSPLTQISNRNRFQLKDHSISQLAFIYRPYNNLISLYDQYKLLLMKIWESVVILPVRIHLLSCIETKFALLYANIIIICWNYLGFSPGNFSTAVPLCLNFTINIATTLGFQIMSPRRSKSKYHIPLKLNACIGLMVFSDMRRDVAGDSTINLAPIHKYERVMLK